MKFIIDSTDNLIHNGVHIQVKDDDNPILIPGKQKPEIRNILEIDVVYGADEKDVMDYIASKIGVDSTSQQMWGIRNYIFTCLYCHRMGRIQNV